MIISASALGDFAFCPKLYYIKHILKIFNRNKWVMKGKKEHEGTEEVEVELKVGKVSVKGRSDFVRKNKIVELKASTPSFWISHVTQASVYANGLKKGEIEILYRWLGLRLVGKPIEIEDIVKRVVEAHRSGIFKKNSKYCSLCKYRKICSVIE